MEQSTMDTINFWKNADNCNTLLRMLKAANVPVWNCFPITIQQVRYEKDCSCIWRFFPQYIAPRKRSIKPIHQSYIYLMRVEKYDTSGKTAYYSAKINTAWDGTLLEQEAYEGDVQAEFPFKFAFPKQVLKKMNQCLADNFWPNLWRGPNYAAWHRADDGITAYMGMRGLSSTGRTDSLLELLRTGAGDAAAILLSYTCFSVLKPFFARYHSLCKTTPYPQAKKYLPSQLAMNVRSNDPEVAETLVNLCCGCFQLTEGNTMPVIDGVSIQKIPTKPTSLGIDEFESKLLQPACVLWVNRKPTEELRKSGRIIDIQLPDKIEVFQIEPFIEFAIAHFTDKISEIEMASRGAVQKADWDQAGQAIESMIKEILDIESKSCFAFTINLYQEWGIIKNKLDLSIQNPIFALKRLQKIIQEDIQECRNERRNNFEAVQSVDEFEEKVNKHFGDCKRSICKSHQQNRNRCNHLEVIYEETLQEMRRNRLYRGFDTMLIEKLAYLSSAIHIFSEQCIRESERENLCATFDRALAAALKSQIAGFQASDILEEYIARLIRAKQCARIRGEGSSRENVRVWYEPRAKMFLLPAKTYFNELNLLLNDVPLTKRMFEDELVSKNIIDVVQRQNQTRRSSEVKVKKDGARISVLKIPLASLTERFFTNEINRALKSMDEDHTRLRA